MTNEEKKRENKKKIHKVFVERVDELCKSKGFTYYNLSYKASIPMTTLTHIIKGSSSDPGIYTIIKICDGLGMTLAEFFDTKEFEDAIAESRDEK